MHCLNNFFVNNRLSNFRLFCKFSLSTCRLIFWALILTKGLNKKILRSNWVRVCTFGKHWQIEIECAAPFVGAVFNSQLLTNNVTFVVCISKFYSSIFTCTCIHYILCSIVGCLEEFLIQLANISHFNANFVINELKSKVLSNSTLLLIKIFGMGRFALIPPHSLSVLLQAFEGSFPTRALKELHLTCFLLYTFPFQIESYRK